MSSINSVGSSSNSAAVYQEYLARLQAQKKSGDANASKQPAQTPPTAATGDVDHDGDSK